MTRKDTIHNLLHNATLELLGYIEDVEAQYDDNWVPAVQIKEKLALNFVAVPQGGTQYGPKGWLFAILARMLEDKGLVEHRLDGNRALYRSLRIHRGKAPLHSI